MSIIKTPTERSLKRRFSEMFSPLDSIQQSPNFKDTPKLQITKKKLQFSIEDSPAMIISKPIIIDENSCDSGYSDIQTINDHIDDVDSFDFNGCDSPMTQLNNLQNKMRKSSSTSILKQSATKNRFNKKHKSEKFDEKAIKAALDRIENQPVDNSRLIGDMSRTHTLPIMGDSKHKDLASITPSTLASLIKGDFEDKINKYIILDARYPYEFEGGHIENAESAYVKEQLFKKIFDTPLTSNDKPVVLIIHCEFSSERGPKLMREIRERDRHFNKQCYPNLYYPEMYLLEGGYKSFYENHDNLCEPKGYLPMHHESYRQDLKHFRAKSKSWDADTKKRLTKSKLKF